MSPSLHSSPLCWLCTTYQPSWAPKNPSLSRKKLYKSLHRPFINSKRLECQVLETQDTCLTEVPINTSKRTLASPPSITQYLWLLPALLIPPVTLNCSLQGAGFLLLPSPLPSDPCIIQLFWLCQSHGLLAWATFLGWWLLSCHPLISPLMVQFSLLAMLSVTLPVVCFLSYIYTIKTCMLQEQSCPPYISFFSFRREGKRAMIRKREYTTDC